MISHCDQAHAHEYQTEKLFNELIDIPIVTHCTKVNFLARK